MLNALEGKCDMAIISTNSGQAIKGILAKHGALSFFRSISGGEDATGKVDRLRRCVSSLGALPQRTIYVCDTAGDVREAREAGVGAVAVSWACTRWRGSRPPSPTA